MKLMEERKTSVDIQSMWKRRSNAPGAEPEAKNAIFDFDVPVEIRADHWRTIKSGLVVGGLLGVQAILGIAIAGKARLSVGMRQGRGVEKLALGLTGVTLAWDSMCPIIP